MNSPGGGLLKGSECGVNICAQYNHEIIIALTGFLKHMLFWRTHTSVNA